MTKEKNLQVVKNTGEAKVLEEFTKQQNINISFKTVDDYQHKESFTNIKGYSLHGPYLVVREQDDTEHVFSMADIQRLKLFYTIKE